jgi:type II secretory pathway predicted ATPase ExeA
MSKSFFGFQKTPFQRDIPVSELFLTPAHEEMVSRLQYAAQNRMFAIATGEVGVGKSTAIRKLVNLLNPNKFRSVYISDSALTPRNFFPVELLAL